MGRVRVLPVDAALWVAAGVILAAFAAGCSSTAGTAAPPDAGPGSSFTGPGGFGGGGGGTSGGAEPDGATAGADASAGDGVLVDGGPGWVPGPDGAAGAPDSGSAVDGGPVGGGEDSTGAPGDVAVDAAADTASLPCATPCGGGCCTPAESCLSFGCAVTAGPCASDDECDGDTWCHLGGATGVCVPYGTGPKAALDPGCEKIVPPGVFFPSLQCEWSGPGPGDPFPTHRQVLGTPMVAPLDTGGGPSAVTGHVVFVSYDQTDGGFPSGSCCGVVRIIRGSDCGLADTLGDAFVVGGSAVAIADLDLAPDGRPEIVALADGGGLVAFHFDPAAGHYVLLWHSTEPGGANDTLASGVSRWNGPTVADLAGDAHPEILVDGVVYGWDGVKLSAGLGWSGYGQGLFPVVADVDLDQTPEVVLGSKVLRWDDATAKLVAAPPPIGAGVAAGYTAIADFGPFGTEAGLSAQAAEIAVVEAGTVTVRDLTGAVIFGPIALPGGGTGGPPTIGDFDGDGAPEVAAAGLGAYTVFDPGCAVEPLPAECAAPGVLWTRPSQDQSSSKTGSSIFDFEGDGVAEAVYGDECFVRVYDGRNGDVLFSGPRASCTWHENPVVADVDGDFRTEIVVGSNSNCAIACPALDPIFVGLRCDAPTQCASGDCVAGLCRCTGDAGCPPGYACAAPPVKDDDGLGNTCRAAHTGKIEGIRVYSDSRDRWVASRPIWNQHAYNVTNVTTAGGIPPKGTFAPGWTQPGLNSFRANAPGSATPAGAPDLTVKPSPPGGGPALTCAPDGTRTVSVQLCNHGITPVAPGVAVAVTGGGASLCTALSVEPIDPGACAPVQCTFSGDPGAATLALHGDAGDAAEGAWLECNEGNNDATISAECP